MSKTSNIKVDIAKLEACIGYQFKDVESAKLIEALTHASIHKGNSDGVHYERMEFLGDRVLGLIIAQKLFAHFPDSKEGDLSLRLNALVKGVTCAEIAQEIGLQDYVRLGDDMKSVSSKRLLGVWADVLESLIASIYIDGGLEAATNFVSKFWDERLESTLVARRDSKTKLQEWAHANNHTTPKYILASRDGPDHDPQFIMEVQLSEKLKAQGNGSSKRAAEQDAAGNLLLELGVWQEKENLD